jgi:UDP-2,3-diacylglucosamine pyrophosphatase LpxH
VNKVKYFDSGKSIKKKKRPVEIAIISDVHLGTYGCRAKELHRYLKSIKPSKVILNGDIIDMWQFNKRYFPKSHLRILNKIVKWVRQGVEVYYLTGNHDEMLRKFSGTTLGTLTLDDKLVLEVDGKKIWIFHGDVFDITMKHSKWLTRIGAHGYDLLILLNTLCNWLSERMGRGRISFSKSIKNKVKSAVKFINSFEAVCAEIAIENQYDVVVCGHIHQPEMKTIKSAKGEVLYLNSGDWVENLTALEYNDGSWSIYRFDEWETSPQNEDGDDEENETVLLDNKTVFNRMFNEMSSRRK